MPLITQIINASIGSASVPAALKSAIITPVLKKPSLDANELNNYRPISNLNFVGKIMEKVVASQLHEHLSRHQLLEPLQSAYRKHHSTETALVSVQDDVAAALDQGKVAILVLLDLSAAFDTIEHSLLLARCEQLFGIKGAALKWLKSYLEERSQRVVIKSSTSSSKDLQWGVPQGSVLGPLLFILYTSPLGALLRDHEIQYHFYADDTQLYLSAHADDIYEKIAHMERVIAVVEKWMADNMLKFNASKTEVLLIHDRRGADVPDDITLRVSGNTIRPSSRARNIGVIFDETLSMIPHINGMSSTLHYHLRNVHRIRSFLPRAAAEQLVHALISSRLDYGNALLMNLPACRLRPLQLAQNTAARIVMRAGRRDHVTPLLRSLHWLPVEARIKFKVAMLTFKALHGMAPDYLSLRLRAYNPTRSLRSSDEGLLMPSAWRVRNYGLRRFSVAAPLLWNSLPTEIRKCHTLTSFKKNVKNSPF